MVDYNLSMITTNLLQNHFHQSLNKLNITYYHYLVNNFLIIIGARGWIRTTELERGRIYSPLPLTTQPPLHFITYFNQMIKTEVTWFFI